MALASRDGAGAELVIALFVEERAAAIPRERVPGTGELFEAEGAEFEIYDGLRDIPPYDEDDDVQNGYHSLV